VWSWLVTVGGRDGELLVLMASAVGPPSTTVGSVSSELVRSMTIVTPVELIGLISMPGRGEVSVLPVVPGGWGGERRRLGGLCGRSSVTSTSSSVLRFPVTSSSSSLEEDRLFDSSSLVISASLAALPPALSPSRHGGWSRRRLEVDVDPDVVALRRAAGRPPLTFEDFRTPPVPTH